MLSPDIEISTDPDQPLFPRLFESYVPTRVTGATDLRRQSEELVLARVAETNAQANIVNILMGPDNLKSTLMIPRGSESLIKDADTLRYLQTHQMTGYLVGINSPTSAYSEGGLMTTATDLKRIFKPTPDTFMIYDAPPTVQVEYWNQLLGLITKTLELQDLQDPQFPDLTHVIPLVVGHHAREVRTPEHNGIRTLAIQHDLFLLFRPDLLVPVEWDMEKFRLLREQQLLLRHLRGRDINMVDDLIKPLNLALGDRFTLRTQLPIGYQTRIDMTKPAEVAELMYRHHTIYAQQAASIEARIRTRAGYSDRFAHFIDGQIVQPAYGIMVIPENKQTATMIYTPVIADIGPIERAGIHLFRKDTEEFQNLRVWTDEAQVHRLHQALLDIN